MDKEPNLNLNDSIENEENSDLDNFPGIYYENSEDKSKSDNDIKEDDNYEFYMENEIIPYSPEMSEEPINPSERKRLITDSINNKNEINGENIFTFKNCIKRTDSNFKEYNNLEDNDIDNQFKSFHNNKNEEKEKKNQLKANILNFEDVINKKNKDIISNSKNKIKNKNNENIKKKECVNQKLIQKNKNIKNKNINLKKVNKSQKKSNNIKQILSKSSIEAIEFENFMKDKLLNNKSKNKNNNVIKNRKSNKDSINEPIINNDSNQLDIEDDINILEIEKENKIPKILSNKSKANKNGKNNIKKIDKKVIKKSSKNNVSKNSTGINLIGKNDMIKRNSKKSLKKKKINKNVGSPISDNSNDYQNLSKREHTITSIKSPYNYKSLNKKKDINFSTDAFSDKRYFDKANKRFGKYNQRNYFSINNKHSKFEKYDIGQISYEIMKDYSNIRQDKDNDFLDRVKFDSLKRNNKNQIVNKLVEKNKLKLDEPRRKKAFNRLMNDANRRIYEKKQKENLEEIKHAMKYKDLDNDKKYNEEEWNEIYQKRFKNFEDNKKKKIEMNLQKKKIQKMLEEEEEINMCKVIKLPENKIKQNSQRLFDDAKKRVVIQNRKIMNNMNRDNTHLSRFKDVDDISKYMKSYKSEIYNFGNNGYNDKRNNNINKNNKYNFFNEEYYPKSLNKKKKLQKFNNFNNFSDFNNNKRLSTRNNIRKNKNRFFTSNDEINRINNITFDNNYNFNFKKFSDSKIILPKNNIDNEFSIKGFDEYDDSSNLNNSNLNNINNINENEENANNNNNNKQENIVDNFLYDYCMNKFFN